MNPANAPIAPVTIPKIAAIIIAHNQGAELRRALAALERSEPREQLEILVVDCASDDSTTALAEEFPGITVQRLPENFGATKALNIATRTARADYVLLLSPEVEVAPDTIARLAEKLDAAPSLTAACPLLVDRDGKPLARTRRFPDRRALAVIARGGELEWTPVSEEWLSQDSCKVLYPGREAMLVRKQFIAGMNYFDERFGEYWADADLAIKIHKAGRRVEMFPAIRATWNFAQAAPPSDMVHRSDRILGAAALLGKHDGFLAGFGYRMAAILGALTRFDFSLFAALASGKKVGSQAK